ncbi:hypothetical protein QC762_0005610 [Podospora pseudocomata]|uniref:Uncharacterized protein n=1 Tax=Podospora pseudocomata TaxID=2093779 RepID=A0ABR0GTU6_9PEZI|nr:hypothetical protein QC762_0005610 [Podospora pseudocomata]
MWKSRCALCDCWSPGYLEDGRHRSFRPTRLTNLKVFGADPSLRCTRTQESGTAFAGSSLYTILLQLSGLPQLTRLPPELTKMIQNFSADNLVWRLTRVIGIAENGPPLSVMPQAFHLSKISAWERGGEPVLAANGCESAMPQIIRLTVDSRGLQRVERLQEKPVHRPGRSESKAFAVFDERDVRGAVLWFKDKPTAYG